MPILASRVLTVCVLVCDNVYIEWCTLDGDFGCDRSPWTDSEGAGDHMGRSTLTAVLTAAFDNVTAGGLLALIERD